jgi:peptidoglycan hydrolase-like protein with peptidoglycan-binding domain
MRGSTGADVMTLQIYLIAQGDLALGDDTGYFGSLTQAAVETWQSAHAISPVGIVGPLTRAALANCTSSY